MARKRTSRKAKAMTARAQCINRRKGRGKQKKCTSLFYANCLTGKGTIKKTKKCRKIARAGFGR